MIKINDTVLTKQNRLCRVTSIRSKIALLKGIGSSSAGTFRIVACVKDLRTLKPFHGLTTIV